MTEGERDNIFGGLEAGNKKAAPNKEETATGPAGPKGGEPGGKEREIIEGAKRKGRRRKGEVADSPVPRESRCGRS